MDSAWRVRTQLIQGPPGPPGPATAVGGEVRFTVGTAFATFSTTVIPAGSQIYYCSFQVTTPYVGASIQIGNSITPGLLAAPSDIITTVNATAELPLDVPWGGVAEPVLVNISGAPSVGAGVCIVRYLAPTS